MMVEWGVPFDHIEEHWTDRQFFLFAEAMNERLEKQAEAGRKAQGGESKRKGSLGDLVNRSRASAK